MLHSLGYIILF